MAAKLRKSQSEVWENVAEMQADLSVGLEKPVHDAASPTSYQLSVEDPDLMKRKESYRQALAHAIDQTRDAVGYVFAINGEINTADVYGSGTLFRKLWSKLLDAAVLEAIAEAHRRTREVAPVTAGAITRWFAEMDSSRLSDRQEVPPRVCVETRRSGRNVVFDTRDHGIDDAVLHRNLVCQDQSE